MIYASRRLISTSELLYWEISYTQEMEKRLAVVSLVTFVEGYKKRSKGWVSLIITQHCIFNLTQSLSRAMPLCLIALLLVAIQPGALIDSNQGNNCPVFKLEFDAPSTLVLSLFVVSAGCRIEMIVGKRCLQFKLILSIEVSSSWRRWISSGNTVYYQKVIYRGKFQF